MKLTRDLISERYDNGLKEFYNEDKVQSGEYELIFRGSKRYQGVNFEENWTTRSCFKKDGETDRFIEWLLAYMKEPIALDEKAQEINQRLDEFIREYCDYYGTDFSKYDIGIIYEDLIPFDIEYKCVLEPFQLFITYNDKGKHYKVTL